MSVTQSVLLDENLLKVEQVFVRLVRGLPKSLEIKAVSSSIDFLRKLNPHVVRSAEGLARMFLYVCVYMGVVCVYVYSVCVCVFVRMCLCAQARVYSMYTYCMCVFVHM